MKKEFELLAVILICTFITSFFTWLSMKQYYEPIIWGKQELIEFYQGKWISCGEYSQKLWEELFDCLRGKAVNKTCVVMYEGDTLLTNKTTMITPYERVIITTNGTIEACWEHGVGIFTAERMIG